MKYFRVIDELNVVFGAKFKYKNMSDYGISMTTDMQMKVDGKTITFGKIINEGLFNNSNLKKNYFVIFDNIDEVNEEIDNLYVEVLGLTDSVALQLDLQFSKKTDIKGYDSKQSINSQYNLKKIKEDNLGGIKVVSKKAKID